jgi:drug/metabolite transporter (DMT)-like permease
VNNKQKLNIGATILTVGYIGLSTVSFIIAKDADLDTRQGRHLLAGALANVSFSIAQIMITNFALRKGEKWAWWSNLIPAFSYGLVILIIDATHVQPTNLFSTLAPQVGGLIILGIGLIISGVGLFSN